MSLYICNTPYHLLISIIKAFTDKNSELIITHSAVIGKDVVERLEQSEIFTKITTYKHTGNDVFFTSKYGLRSIKKYRDDLDAAIHYKLPRGTQVYIFFDIANFGKWLNIHRIKYHVLEDAYNCFKGQTPPPRWVEYEGKSLKARLKRFFRVSYGGMAMSPLIQSVEVNDDKDIWLKRNNIIVRPRISMFQGLTREQKELICFIFLSEEQRSYIQKLDVHNDTLLITQPLSEDVMIGEQTKIQLYKFLIDKYTTGTVYIKPHPREARNIYEDFPRCKILQLKNVPLEVLGFFENIHFKRGITVFSSTIESLDYFDEKVSLGYEWMKNFENELYAESGGKSDLQEETTLDSENGRTNWNM